MTIRACWHNAASSDKKALMKSRPPSQPPRPRHSATAYALAWLAFALSIGLTLALWRSSLREQEAARAALYEQRVAVLRAALQQRLADHEALLQGAAGLLAASSELSQAQWSAFVTAQQLEQRWPGVQGLGRVLMLHPNQAAAHESARRAEGQSDYSIRPSQAGTSQLAVSVLFEPQRAGYEALQGYDLYSAPELKSAMKRARDAGRAAISAPSQLLQQGAGRSSGSAELALFLPLYRSDPDSGTPAQRQETLTGYVYAWLRPAEVLQDLLEQGSIDSEIALFDSDEAGARLLHGKAASGRIAAHSLDLPLAVAGQRWLLRARSSAEFDAANRSRQPTLVLAGGLALDILLFASLLLYSRQRRLRLLLEASNEGLRSATRHIRSLIEYSLDPLFTTDAHGRITDVNRAAELALGQARDRIGGTELAHHFVEHDQARAACLEALARGALADCQLHLLREGRQPVAVLCNFSVYRNEAGRVAGLLVTAHAHQDRRQPTDATA